MPVLSTIKALQMLILSIIYQNVKEQEEKKGKRNKRIRNARGFLNKAHPSVAASKSWILFEVRTIKKYRQGQ